MKRLLFIAFTAISINGIAQTNILPLDGNVGIGTTNPLVKLHVVNSISGFNKVISINSTSGKDAGDMVGIGFNSECCGSWSKGGMFYERTGGYGVGKLHFLLNASVDSSDLSASNSKMTLDNNGNVGIGTTNPLYKLSINGVLGAGNNTRGDGGYGGIDFTDNGIGYSQAAKIYTFRSSSSGEYYGFTNDYDGAGAQLSIIAKQSTGNITFYTGDPATMKMKITSSGNVGIATTNPQSPLHIKASTGYGSVRISPISDNAESSMGFFSDANGTSNSTAWVIGNSAWGNTGKFIIGNQTAGGPIITTLQNGNVGIGTTNPDEKLTVNGVIHAKEVKVDLSGPLADYVFKPTYKLMPLPQVEQFVKKNSHLPEMPSACEITKNGLSMGEMQNKLLQKVEELTLYAIQQNKKIMEQEKKNNELELELNTLKKVVANDIAKRK